MSLSQRTLSTFYVLTPFDTSVIRRKNGVGLLYQDEQTYNRYTFYAEDFLTAIKVIEKIFEHIIVVPTVVRFTTLSNGQVAVWCYELEACTKGEAMRLLGARTFNKDTNLFTTLFPSAASMFHQPWID